MTLIERPKSLVRYPKISMLFLLMLMVISSLNNYWIYTLILNCYMWILIITIFERETLIEWYEQCYFDVMKIHKNIKLFMK